MSPSVGIGIGPTFAGEALGLPRTLPDLEAWYTFDDAYMTLSVADVTQLNDRSGNARHMTVPGSENAPSYSGGIVTFDASNVEALQVATFSLEQPTTIVGWVKTTGGATDSVWDGTAATVCRLYGNLSGLAIMNAGSAVSAAGSDITAWSRVACVYNGASSSIAINNGTPSTGDAGAGDAGGFTLGARGDLAGNGNVQFKGHLVIYSRALSAAELTLLDTFVQTQG